MLLEQGDPNSREFADGQIAAKLVEMGCLNHYQATQILGGRTKFTLSLYHIIDCIGAGGMGQVYTAEHPVMARIVAVKVLPRDKCTPESITSFNREIRTLAQLEHENLVRAYDAGRDNNIYFLVTEYVPGSDLRKLVRTRGRLNANQAATIITQAAKGLAHAHSRGLIHRDVKPGNLLVSPDGRTKVSDLGLAASLGADDDPRAGKVVGTADYLSPEQILTPHDLTPATDVYALGCTLYYAVTGKVPFPGGTTRDKLRRHCDATPINPRRLNPDLPEAFIEVIADMMNKNPRERIGTMEEVIARLAPWASERIEEGQLLAAPAAAAPISFIPTPEPAVADMKDTEPAFLDVGYQDPWYADSPSQVSQISQGTDPSAATSEETRPQYSFKTQRPLPASDEGPRLSRPVAFLIGFTIAVAISLIAAFFIVNGLKQ